MRNKVAIVNSNSFGRYFPEHIEEMEKKVDVHILKIDKDIDGKELACRLQEYKYIVFSAAPNYNKYFFENSPNLRLLTRHGLGYDNVDTEAAAAQNIYVAKVPGGAEGDAVAEASIALLLSVLRNVPAASCAAGKSQWQSRGQFIGSQIREKTVGIIGLGNIGGKVANILKNGFMANVIVYDKYLGAEDIKKHGYEAVPFQELLEKSDIISLHAFLPNKYEHLISAKEFSLMKKDVVLINTARGGLIDTAALIENLESKKVGAVGLDVIEGEPIDGEHPILGYPNVIVTPHIGAYTYEAIQRMGEKIVADILSMEAGGKPAIIVNGME